MSTDSNLATEAAETLRLASEILEERGHCKGEINDDQGRVCMWGAIQGAVAQKANYRIRAFIWKHIAAAFGETKPFPGASWNDEEERTGTEVQKFLLEQADKIEFDTP